LHIAVKKGLEAIVKALTKEEIHAKVNLQAFNSVCVNPFVSSGDERVV
jgi:hypothetical protein